MAVNTVTANVQSNTLSTVSDQDIRDIAEGKPDAVRRLYEKTHRSIYGFALSITKNAHDAEDALQETFVSLYRFAGEYKPNGKPMAWILTIARNAARMKIRARKQELSYEDAFDYEDSTSEIQNVDDRMALEAAMTVLDDKERQILMLHAVSGLKNREIAALLELSIGTVLSKYHRALTKLRNHLKGTE